MNSGQQVRETFKEYTTTLDDSLREVFSQQTNLKMYKHLAYFMGFLDDSLQPAECYAGKRFRSALCLMLADWYGEKESGIPVATSLELFHNFTLIHDDIVDGDTLRRGRPTVWKLFGTDHAINGGDSQLVLSLQAVLESSVLPAEQKIRAQSFLLQQYLKVIEGQYLDFELTDAKLGDTVVNKERYLMMVSRKTADLIAAATKAAGIVSGKDDAECDALFEYGYSLGVAYQLCDDMVSIWGSEEQTGKRLYGDLREKKKTMPILRLFECADGETRKRLLSLYNTDAAMTDQGAEEIIEMLESADVYTHMTEEIVERADRAKAAAGRLSLSKERQETLKMIVDQLLPDIKKV